MYALAYIHSWAVAIDICTRIGRRIRYLRLGRGMTQVILADHAQITREHLSELENGKKEIGVRVLERIVSSLGISLSVFFDDRIFRA
jgi:transcriptional regulator with XRE-family HTH domain